MLTRDCPRCHAASAGRFVVPLRSPARASLLAGLGIFAILYIDCKCSFVLHVKQVDLPSQPCILQPLPSSVYCQLLRWRSLHHFLNVPLILRHWPRNTLATTLPGTKIAFRTLSVPTPRSRMSTTTGGRSSGLTSETWENVAISPQVCTTLHQGTLM